MSLKSKTIGGTIITLGLMSAVVYFGDMLGTVGSNGERETVVLPGAKPDHKAANRDEHLYTLVVKFAPNNREVIVRWGVDNTLSFNNTVFKSPWSETSKVPAGRKIHLAVSQLEDDEIGTIECYIYTDGKVTSHNKRDDYGQIRCETVAI